MNDHTGPWETEMSREFDQRVRDLHEAPLTLDHVKGRAGRIRRTRRLAAAGGALAAAAVIVPIVVFAGGNLTDDSGPEPAPKPTPNPTVIDPSGPGFGYLEGKTLHRADGTTTELAARYTWATQIGATVFAVRTDDSTGEATLDVLDESGTPTESVELSSYPVVDDDHTVLAYVERDGDLITRGEAGGIATSTEAPEGSVATAVTRDSVYLEDGTGEGAPLVVDPATGATRVAVPDAIGLQDADASGLLTVQTSYTDQGSCGGVYDQATAKFGFQTCDYFLYGLSPGATYLEGTHPYLDGFGNAYASILDATTGKEIIKFDPPDGAIVGTTWQDSEHLLARVYAYESKTWSIFRIGADKTVVEILGPDTAGNEANPAYTVLN